MASALYGFSYSTNSLAFLRGLSKKLRRQVVKKIEALAADPRPPGCKQVKGMSEGEDQVWRIRSGDYRVLYVVHENPSEIIILDVGHRKDVYR